MEFGIYVEMWLEEGKVINCLLTIQHPCKHKLLSSSSARVKGLSKRKKLKSFPLKEKLICKNFAVLLRLKGFERNEIIITAWI